MRLLNINYLPHRRVHYFNTLIKILNKLSPDVKSKIKFSLIKGDGHNISDFPNLHLLDPAIEIEIHSVGGLINYMNKINIATQAKEPYSMKLDEDVFFPPQVLEYIVNNLEQLQDPKSLAIYPSISNGIPGFEYFVNTLLPEHDIKQFYHMINCARIGSYWGVDYSFLNSVMENNTTWNPQEFYNKVSTLNHHYKGIHPIRINVRLHEHLNAKIIEYWDKFWNINNFNLQPITCPYFCNTCFVIKTDEWKSIISQPRLFRDDFDEVPINLYMQKTKKYLLLVTNGLTIHTSYNTIYNSDEHFYQLFKNKI